MAITYLQVANESRVLLNDVAITLYSNAALLPCIKKALRELREEYENIGIAPSVVKQSSVIVAAADGTGNITLPTDITYPFALYEAPSTADADDVAFEPMTQLRHAPLEYERREIIGFWWWTFGEIRVPYASVDRRVRIDYVSGIIADIEAIVIGDNIAFPKHMTYLAAKTASIAAYTIGESEEKGLAFGNDAEKAKERLLGSEIGQAQRFPVRQQAYRRRYVYR